MDFNKLLTTSDHDSGAELQLVHPVTSEQTTVFIKLAGVDSKAFRAAVRERQRQRAESIAKEVLDDGDLEERRDADVLVAATLGWRGLENDGAPMEFTPENVRNLYIQSPGVRSQVERFIYNRRNFIKG